MAQPIPLELPPRDPREELRMRLENAPSEHAEALLDSYELLQQLHDHGVFQLLRGALSASDKLIETTTSAARTDESVRAIRTAIILGYKKPVIEPPGLFSLLSQFRQKELRRSVALINLFLEKLGNQINLCGSCR
jgi:uncharacterized protein YjgD (DUF1641 family)